MSSKPKKQTAQTNQKQKQTTKSQPWAPAKPHAKAVMSAAGDAFAASKPFGGDFIAGPTAGQRSAVDQIYSAAPSLSTGATDLRTMAQRIAQGEFLDPNNPILMSGIAAVTDPVLKQLNEQVLPGLQDAAVQGGAYGGTANAFMNAKAMDDFSRTAQNTGAGMTLDWLNNRWGDVFKTPGMFEAANKLQLSPAMAMMLGGDYERSLDQLGLDNELAKYQNEMQMLWGPLQNYYNIASGLGGAFGTKTQSGTTKGTTQHVGSAPDMATQLFQGGMGGLGTLSSLGQAFPQTMGAMGAAGPIGSIVSGLGFLSDRRYKKNIKKVGKLDNGLAVYRFQYDGQDAFTIGLMADEVEEIRPEAVEEHEGVKFVDYYKATT